MATQHKEWKKPAKGASVVKSVPFEAPKEKVEEPASEVKSAIAASAAPVAPPAAVNGAAQMEEDDEEGGRRARIKGEELIQLKARVQELAKRGDMSKTDIAREVGTNYANVIAWTKGESAPTTRAQAPSRMSAAEELRRLEMRKKELIEQLKKEFEEQRALLSEFGVS